MANTPSEAPRRAHRLRRVGILLLAAGAAGAAAYYGDEKEGDSRRRHLVALLRHTGKRLHREVRHMGSQAFGIEQRIEHRHPAPPIDDLTLLDRVESEIYNHQGVTKGGVTLDVSRGVISLRGEVASWEAADEIERAVRAVDGVKDVENLLHLPHTPAPNKVAALRASRKSEAE